MHQHLSLSRLHSLALLCAIFLCASQNQAAAQAPNYTATQLKQIELEDKNQSIRWAQLNNFPIRIALNDQSTLELIRLQNGRPVFFTTHNQSAGIHTQTDKLHEARLFSSKLTGSGLEIGIWDEGSVLEHHREVDFRVTLQDMSPASNHATHVAGTLIAGGVLPEAKGMAPGAQVKSYNWNFHTSEMQSEAEDGLLLSNHSYGRIGGWHMLSIGQQQRSWYWFGDPRVSEEEDFTFGYYDRDAFLFDHVAYKNLQFLPIVSAGNERDDKGPEDGTYWALDTEGRWIEHEVASRKIKADGRIDGFDTLTSIAVAKNPLTVGSVGLTNTTDSLVISPFSSAGPTDDGRIKPDLVGIGEELLSPIASGESDYARYSGTSMATPNVAGSLLLLQQLARSLRGQPLQAATLKGLAIHTATDIGTAGPDYISGWGLLNTAGAATLIEASFRYPGILQEATLSDGAQIITQLDHPNDGPIRVTLSWTDPPGIQSKAAGAALLNDSTPQLINDLDVLLTHVDSGQIYRPYVLEQDRPTMPASQSNNYLDPLEQIFVDNAPTGQYQLAITHKNELANHAVQPYALLLSGLYPNEAIVELDTAYVDAALGSVNINWQTAAERKPGYFIIERAGEPEGLASSPLSLNFQAIAEINASSTGGNGDIYHFEDAVYLKGIYQYRLLFVEHATGVKSLVTELVADIPAPQNFSIVSVFPNPAHGRTTLAVDLPLDMSLSHTVYDLLGREAFSASSGHFNAGRHFVTLDLSGLSPGIYFIEIQSDNSRLTKKVIVL